MRFPEGSKPDKVPALVLALAMQAAIERVPNPVPIKWRDEGNNIHIIFEDGRCLDFDKWEEEPAPSVGLHAVVEEIMSTSVTNSNWHALVEESEKPKRKEKK